MRHQEPIPPVDLTARLRLAPPSWTDPEAYLERGREARRSIERLLPADWSWAGKRVLDFGCGSGRTIRHFVDAAPGCELWGCDIDPACIAWDREYLDPRIRFLVNQELPLLPLPSGGFDLVYALSVFTHIDRHWAGWLLDLHRILVPGGLLVVTFMSEGMGEAIAGEPWEESRVGMSVYQPGQGWDVGGPMVLHSPWWIVAHWGRLFDVVTIKPADFSPVTGSQAQDNQGAVVLRKGERTATVAELERPDPAEPREAIALQHDVLRLRAELARLSPPSEARATAPPTSAPRQPGAGQVPREAALDL